MENGGLNMLYERKGFLKSVASIFIQGSTYADYMSITQKTFSESSTEDIKAISKDFENALSAYIKSKNLDDNTIGITNK